jgi:hypothetical protein
MRNQEERPDTEGPSREMEQDRIGQNTSAYKAFTKSDQDCKICQEIQVKARRFRKEKDNIARWSKEGSKFTAILGNCSSRRRIDGVAR